MYIGEYGPPSPQEPYQGRWSLVTKLLTLAKWSPKALIFCREILESCILRPGGQEP